MTDSHPPEAGRPNPAQASTARRRLDVRSAAVVVPLVVALVLAGVVIWTRSDPNRRGGYCTNATISVAKLFDIRGSRPPAGGGRDSVADHLWPVASQFEVDNLEVRTPSPVIPAVEVLKRDRTSEEARQAFRAFFDDYLERCLFLDRPT